MINTNVPIGDPRPEAEFVEHECDWCGIAIQVKLECWINNDMSDPIFWERDEVKDISWLDRLCPKCADKRQELFERSSAYMATTAPAWFDPMFCGECWSEDY